MTPTQLRAYVAVVRLGSVRKAAHELAVSDAAVSLHVAQLRKELGDKLFTPTGAGLAFTPGGLRLASRATELLGLQERTVVEVRQAGAGRRLLRVAASSLFSEHAAPGLIELFVGRAQDLDVELGVHRPRDFAALLLTRAVDVAIGPKPAGADPSLLSTPFLNFQVIAVASPDHRAVTAPSSPAQLRSHTWLLGPSAAPDSGIMSRLLGRTGVPESQQQIFQSDSAALDEARRGRGVALAVHFTVTRDLAAGTLKKVAGPHADGVWCVTTLAERGVPAAAGELTRFITTPRATQAMLRGSGVTVGRFKPSIHVTLWS